MAMFCLEDLLTRVEAVANDNVFEMKCGIWVFTYFCPYYILHHFVFDS